MFQILADGDVLRLEGRLDATQAPRLEETLAGITVSAKLECSQLQYISSAGLGVLFSAQKRLNEDGEELILEGLNPHLRELFEIAGFHRIFRLV